MDIKIAVTLFMATAMFFNREKYLPSVGERYQR
jgi:hypothetical protein